MDANACNINELLKGKRNYKKWSITMKTYLLSRGFWERVDPEQPHKDEDPSEQQRDAMVLYTILNSCEAKPFSVIEDKTSAREAWSALQARYSAGEAEENIENETETKSELSGLEQGKETESESSESSEELFIDIGPYVPLFRAAYRGDWEKTRVFLDENPEAIKMTTPRSQMNVLHIAVSEGHLHIVEKLVERMTDEEIEMEDENNQTALLMAIEIGSLAIAQCLIERHKKLATIEYGDSSLPVWYAVTTCRRKMVPYLYSVTPIEDLISKGNVAGCVELLADCIAFMHYDIALSILNRAPELAISPDGTGNSPLWELADSTSLATRASLPFWQRYIYDCIHISSWDINHISVAIKNLEDNQSDKGDSNVNMDSFYLATKMCSGILRKLISIPVKILDLKSIYEQKLAYIQFKEILGCMCKVVETTSDLTKLEKAGIQNAMKQAASVGNIEFIIGIAKANPELVWTLSTSRRVIEAGIESRQPKIFNLIYGLRNKVALVSTCYTGESTSMLHKVAAIASQTLLDRIPGAALQMQKELQWFKEVEAIATPDVNKLVSTDHPCSVTDEKEKLNPHEIFTRSHKELIIAGERWMKDTSSSCTVVGALIITVTFATAFTFPGGNEQSHGFPMFASKKLFRVFMILNAVALSASTTSVLMFLGILTSRYAENDFLTSLPKKLIIGLSSLFLSIAAMLTAFCIGLSVMFNYELWIVLPSALLASVPIALFAVIQFPLLIDILMSTYGPSMFDKNMKRWI